MSLNLFQYLSAIYQDFSRAFVTVTHNIFCLISLDILVLGVLCLIGLNPISKIGDNMSIGDYYSSTRNTKKGIPQGSSLGPSMCLVYVKDIENSQFLNFLYIAVT